MLLHKRWTKSISPEELARLEEWLASDEAFRREARSLETLWEKAAQSSSSFQPDTNRAWERFRKEMQAPAPARVVRFPRLWRVAASIAFLIAAAGTFWYVQSLQPGYKPIFANYEKVRTDSSGYQMLVLPDSSVVLVNRFTKFSYPKKFNGATRNVYLKGEAYFEVKKDSSHPFIVHTPRGQVTVTGTVFNVRAYNWKEKFEEVYLFSGKVNYLAHKLHESADIQPEERVVYNSSVSHLERSNDPEAIPLYWVKGYLDLKNQKLKDILKVMETYFHVKFDVSEIPLDLDCRYTVYLSGKSLEESIGMVEELANFQIEKMAQKTYRITGGYRKPCN